jgi:predicted secreted protein
VHVPADSEVDDLLDVRALLEAETARLAAGAAGPQRVARLREICRKGRAAAEADDFGVAVTTNNAFHAEVAAIAGNSMLAELAEIVGRRVQWYYRLVVPARGQVSWTEHQELVDAIEAADAERAQQLAREHTRRTREAYHASKQPLHVPAPCLWAGGHLPAGGRVLACGGRHLASGGSAPGGGGSAQVRTCPRASGMTGGSLAVPRHTSRSSHSRLARRYDVDAAFMQLELHGCGIHAVCQAAVAA